MPTLSGVFAERGMLGNARYRNVFASGNTRCASAVVSWGKNSMARIALRARAASKPVTRFLIVPRWSPLDAGAGSVLGTGVGSYIVAISAWLAAPSIAAWCILV